jgi:hypothetical protein
MYFRVCSIHSFDLGQKFPREIDLIFLLIAKLLVHLAEKSGRDLAAVQRIFIQHPVVRPTAALRRSGGGRKVGDEGGEDGDDCIIMPHSVVKRQAACKCIWFFFLTNAYLY